MSKKEEQYLKIKVQLLEQLTLHYGLAPREKEILGWIISYKASKKTFHYSNAGIARNILLLEPTKNNANYAGRLISSMVKGPKDKDGNYLYSKGVITVIRENDKPKGKRLDVSLNIPTSFNNQLLFKEILYDLDQNSDLEINEDFNDDDLPF